MLDDRGVAGELIDAGYECYLVGGAVRDLMALDKEPKDIDYATNARPEDMVEVFPSLVPVGEDFGTVLVVRDGVEVEITTYRTDDKYSDGRHPDDVKYSDDIYEDLNRRDFTINAMAIDMGDDGPLEDRTIVDPHNGMRDISRGVIQAVGNPSERMEEDALRVLRGVRFAAKLDFDIGPMTLEAIKDVDLDHISNERIRDEFVKALSGDVEKLISLLRETGKMPYCLPNDFYVLGNLPYPEDYHEYDAYTHSVKVAESLPSDQPLLRLAGLLHDVGKVRAYNGDPDEPHFYGHEKDGADLVEGYMRDLRFSNDEIRYVTTLIRHHMVDPPDNRRKRFIRRLYRKLEDEELLRDLISLRTADLLAHGKNDSPKRAVKVKSLLPLLDDPGSQPPELAIDGNDVVRIAKSHGYEPGPVIGECIDHLREKVDFDPTLNNEDGLLEEAHDYFEDRDNS